ncbi:MAG TPA: GntR family transcriptional regulator [Hyphomicrobiaceae bacterium]|nr:GntR family transcriptional regulator [Hyphomicrobiaceae bacterium]
MPLERIRAEDHGLPLEAIEPRRLYRQIADQLRHLIDQGEFAVGSRLPAERMLADRLGVSRPTVREALIALEVEGRLKIRVGSGIYVVEPQPAVAVPANVAIEGPLELLRARAFVESAIAEEAAARAKSEDIDRLDEILIEVDHQHSGDELIALDRRFHTAIATILDNAVLVRFVGELFDLRINPYFEQLARHIENASTWKETHLEHIVIRDAIAARDPLAARAAMRNHLAQAHGRFSRDFGEPALTAEASDLRSMQARIVA